MDIKVGRTEVEDLGLEGYTIENRGDVSGGAAIKTLGEGSASGTFKGEAGLHRLTVNYLDESDGQATFELRINGVAVETWQGTGGTLGFGSAAAREIEVALQPGDTISLHGARGQEELARFDSIDLDFISAPPAADPASTLDVGLTEAETLDLSGGYEIQGNAAAANGTVIGTLTQGVASGRFSGPDGTYDLTVNYLDESDGEGTFRLLVNGAEAASWTGDGGNSPAGTPETETVTLTLSQGDTIAIEGTRADGEAARVDSVLIQVADGGNPPADPPPSPPAPPPSGDLASISVGQTEAEALTLEGGYEVETRSDASGGQAIRTLDAPTGTASGRFDGPDGQYELTIDYFNESDGVATWIVLVNGEEKDRFVGTGGQGGIGTAATETVSLALANGDTIAIQGIRGDGELARIDAISLAPTAPDTGPVPSPPPAVDPGVATLTVGTTEAEALTLDGDYETETRADASGGRLIRILTGTEGTATGTFSGDAGTYDIAVDYFDENDGQATFQLLLNGAPVETWTGFGGTSGLGTSVTRTVTVDLSDGDVISLAGRKSGGELARFDSVTIAPSSDAPTDPGSGPSDPASATIGLGLTEAEALDLSGGYEVQSNGAAGNGLVIGTLTTGQAAGAFDGAGGAYDITVNYLDESDGVGSWSLSVNGFVEETWLGTGGTSPSGSPASRTISVDLQPGDVIAINGVRSDGEAARVDSLDVSIAGSAPIDPGTDPDPGPGPVLPGPIPGGGPGVAAPIPNLFVVEGEAFAYQIPSGTFEAGDPGSVSLSASFRGGGTKGNWLEFDATSGTFLGTPPSTLNGAVIVDVVATGNGGTAEDRFVLSILSQDADAASIGTGRTEAEDLVLTNFTVEARSDASGGESIVNDSAANLAYLTGAFDGPAGNYDLTLAFFNESGGTEAYAIEVNGVSTDFILTPSGGSSNGEAQSLAINVDLTPGDEIAIVARDNGRADARVDFIDIASTAANAQFSMVRAEPETGEDTSFEFGAFAAPSLAAIDQEDQASASGSAPVRAAETELPLPELFEIDPFLDDADFNLA